jgi:hypothetical protein
MHREDNSKYLLYIEPAVEKKSAQPVDDEWTRLVEAELAMAKEGAADYGNPDDQGTFFEGGWRGVHRTACGESGGNHDYLLSNGMITNKLAAFYLRWYREAIPASEWRKLKHLAQYHEATKMVRAHKQKAVL